MFGLGAFPEGEIDGVAFFVLAVEGAHGALHVFHVAAGKDAVVVGFIVFFHIEIDRSLAFVSVAVVDNLFYQFDLLDDMARGVRLDAGGQYVQRIHGLMVAVQVILYYFHRLQLLEACLFGYLVFAFVGVVLEVAYVGDVAYVAHLITQMGKVTE